MLSRLATVVAIAGATSALALAACTHTTDRVIEPVGAGDASTTTPEVSDAGLKPLGPIAPLEREDDYRLVRAPEVGIERNARLVTFSAAAAQQLPGLGGMPGAGGSSGTGGSDRRPVSSGGSYF